MMHPNVDYEAAAAEWNGTGVGFREKDGTLSPWGLRVVGVVNAAIGTNHSGQEAYEVMRLRRAIAWALGYEVLGAPSFPGTTSQKPWAFRHALRQLSGLTNGQIEDAAVIPPTEPDP